MGHWIRTKNIKCYAYHGCLPEETAIGAWYEIDVNLETDFSEAAMQDDLSKTIDYVDVNRLVVKEMEQASKLVEHVLERIKVQVFSQGWTLLSGSIVIRKLNPPIGGNVDCVELELNW